MQRLSVADAAGKWEPVKLANDAMLAGVAFAIGILLAVVFPTRLEFDAATDALPEHAYSAAYLEVIVKANPNDEHSRLAYARQLGHRGDFRAALAELAQLPQRGHGDVRDTEVSELRFDFALDLARSLPVGSPERADGFAEVGRELEALTLGWHASPKLAEYAEIALGIERPRAAADLYLTLADRSTDDERARWLARAGRWLRASGDPIAAATAYQQAAASTPDRTASRAWLAMAVTSLEAGNRVERASELASRLAAAAPNDASSLAEAARLALFAGHPTLARDLGRHLLRLHPLDSAERDRQALRELAAGDAMAALPLVRDAVKRHPTDPAWREREAHVAEWAGAPTLAMKDWVWLARLGGSHRPEGLATRNHRDREVRRPRDRKAQPGLQPHEEHQGQWRDEEGTTKRARS